MIAIFESLVPQLFFCFISVYVNVLNIPPPSPFPRRFQSESKTQTLSHRNHFYDDGNVNPRKHNIEINYCNILHLFIFGIAVVALFFLFYFNICNNVRYVSFNTNLNLFSKKETMKTSLSFRTSLLLIMLGLFLIECEKDQIILFICTNSNCVIVFDPTLTYIKIISWTIIQHYDHVHLFDSSYSGFLHFMPDMVIFVYKKCTSSVANLTNYIVK